MRRGGAQQLIFDIFRNFPRDRYHLSLFSFRNKRDSLALELENYGFRVFYANVKRPYHNPRILYEIYKVVRLNQIDIAHTHLHRGSSYGRLAAWFCGNPKIVMTEHSGLSRSLRPWRERLENRLLETITDKIVFISRWSANQYRPIKNSVIIKNCIDSGRFQKRNGGDKLRKIFGFKQGEILVGTVANFNSEKGHCHLIEAIPRIVAQLSIVKFIFVGWGYLENSLKRRVIELDLENYVVFLGARDDVPDLMKIFDLFVLPSNYEAFGIVLLEAMINSLAVVATNVGGIPEVVVDGKTGILVSPGRPEALARAVTKLIMECDLRETLGKAGKERVLRKFSIQRYVSELTQVYENVLIGNG
jgi:glycosyltransferase involved in cell wall biosynthesis